MDRKGGGGYDLMVRLLGESLCRVVFGMDG